MILRSLLIVATPYIYIWVRYPMTIYVCNGYIYIWVTHSIGHDMLICLTWLIHVREMILFVCDMAHLYAWHDTLTLITWLLLVCDISRLLEAAHCNTLQRTATHCNTLQHTATSHLFEATSASVSCKTLVRTATHCNKLQHTTTHCQQAPFWSRVGYH